MKWLECNDFLIADLLEDKGINYFICSYPNEERIYAGASKILSEGINHEGYVLTDFYGKSFTIPADLSLEAIEKIDSKKVVEEVVKEETTSKTEHLGNVSEIVEILRKESERGKVVLSGVIRVSRKNSLSKILTSLRRAYPSAYIFAFHTPLHGLWIGASPELLLSWERNTLQTMSLAGTQKVGSGEEWDKKNIEEQKIVTDFIVKEINKSGLNAEVSPLFTRKAGPVEHLCSSIKVENVERNLGIELALRLSPTPALSGYPREKALKIIDRLEAHRRDCYGGFSGLSAEEFFKFYVTLRCCRLYDKEALLYSGGGITPLSLPKSEWEEIQMKSSTLLRYL